MTMESQESRTETIGASVTAREKWFVQLVARKEDVDVSTLLRTHIAPIIERGRRIHEAIERLPEESVA